MSQEEEEVVRQMMLASLETAREWSTSRQAQGQEVQPILVNFMNQLQIMNQNIHGLRDDMKELGGRMGHLEVDVKAIKKHLYGNR